MEFDRLRSDYLFDLSNAIDLTRAGKRDQAVALIADPASRKKIERIRELVETWRETNADMIAALRARARNMQVLAMTLIGAGLFALLLLAIWMLRDTRRYIKVILDLVGRLRTSASILARRIEERSQALRIKSEQLEATLDRFNIATQAANITVFEQDLDRRYKWVSRGAPGLTPEQVVGLREEDVLPENAVGTTVALKSQLLETGQSVSADIHGTRDGEDVWWHVRVHPINDDAGRLTGMIGTSINVTEQKLVSNLVAERESRLQIAADAASLGIFEWNLGSRISIWDRRMMHIFDRNETEGGLDKDGFIAEKLHPDDRDAFMRAMAEGAANGSIERQEWRFQKADGSVGWMRMSARFDTYVDGQPQHLVGVVEDITTAKTNALEQERNLALLRAVTDSTPDLIYTKDTGSRLMFANPALLSVLDRRWEDIAGRSEIEWHDQKEEARITMANDMHVIESGKSEITEEIFTTGNGLVTFLSTKAPLFDSLGNVTGLVGISTDITERKANEEQRQFLMRELTHRSKNLLAVVQSMARQTVRNSSTMEEFHSRFSARLMGLATSHDLLLQEEWRGASIRQLVISQLGHLIDMIDTRILMTGPDGMLQPEAAQNIGLALHELSTNAAKYGALSNESGKVYIRWGLLPGNGEHEQFFINWQEDGGPPVQPPTRRGFGHSVMERLVARALDGKVELTFDPSGVVWRLEISRSHVMKLREEDEEMPVGDFESAAIEALGPARKQA